MSNKHIVPRFDRSAQRTVIRVPAPVSLFGLAPDADGVLIRHLFPTTGVMKYVIVDIGKWTGSGKLTFVVSNDITTSETLVLNAKKGRFTVSDMAVSAGDKVTLKFTPVADTDTIGEVYVAFQFQQGAD